VVTAAAQRGTRITGYEISLISWPAGRLIQVDVRIEAEEKINSPTFFVMQPSALRIVKAEASSKSAPGSTLRLQRLADGLIALFLETDTSVCQAEIRFLFEVQDAAAEVLCFPRDLPQLINRWHGELPKIHWYDPRSIMPVAGTEYCCERSNHQAWVDLVVSPAAKRVQTEEGEVMVLPSLSNRCTPARLDRICALSRRILGFLSREIGVAIPVIPTVGLAAHPRVTGSYIQVRSESAFGIGQDEPDDVALATRLGGIWWGSALQLDGPGALELEAAMRTAVAIHWARYVGNWTEYRDTLERLERIPTSLLAKDLWRTASGLFRYSRHRRLSVGLVRRLDESTETRLALQKFALTSVGQRRLVSELAGVLL
jgi:hypothetical protein